MSHPEQLSWFAWNRQCLNLPISDLRIVEVGSADVYGSVRGIFQGARDYVGLDLAMAPGVDVVVSGGVIPVASESVDVVLNAEALEHDPNWRLTIEECLRVLRPGGLLVMSCAGPGRPEHGTQRTDAQESPGTQEAGLDYYKNLSVAEVLSAIEATGESVATSAFTNTKVRDTYVSAVKAGPNPVADAARLRAFDIDTVNKRIQLPRRVAWLPVHLSIAVIGAEKTDGWSWRYWNLVRRLRPSNQEPSVAS